MKAVLIQEDLKIGRGGVFFFFLFLNSTRHLNPDQNITEFGGEILLENGLFAASLV